MVELDSEDGRGIAEPAFYTWVPKMRPTRRARREHDGDITASTWPVVQVNPHAFVFANDALLVPNQKQALV